MVRCWIALLSIASAAAQPAGFNYDESKVPSYELPPLLESADGEKITDAEAWRSKRRPEILKLFEEQVYGRAPAVPDDLDWEIFSLDSRAFDGKAVRKQVRVRFARKPDAPAMDLLIYLPANAPRPVPIFLGLNFAGDHSIHPDPGIKLSESWMRENPERGVVNHRATAASRGASQSRWPVEEILARGYGLATVYYGDIDPDFDDGFKNGVHALYPAPKPDEWGSLAAWGWGLSRAMDYFEADAEVDQNRVALLGHSRLGKAALWAGARDERFALVISNSSGCGGAALSRRRFGETVARINTAFPHWFADNFNRYNDDEDALPVDQHMLIALIAPRPVYVASAEEDLWADPRGEFLSAKAAGEVYKLFGKQGLDVDEMPPVEQPIHNDVGYHVRRGKHDITLYDWQRYLDFADKHLSR